MEKRLLLVYMIFHGTPMRRCVYLASTVSVHAAEIPCCFCGHGRDQITQRVSQTNTQINYYLSKYSVVSSTRSSTREARYGRSS